MGTSQQHDQPPVFNEQKRARRILRFRRYSNYLVVSFSLFSSVFTVLFTTNVEKMLNGAPNESILKIAVPAMISLIFAEMIPQAVCNSNLGFDLASGLWFVSGLIFIVTFPIAYPVSLVLERFLKRDVREVLTEEEKTCMIQNMAKNANEKVKTILENATTFTNKKVGELMIPISDVFMLSRSQKLNRSVIHTVVTVYNNFPIQTILTLVEKGYTRVPVYDDKNRNTIVGLLNMKDLNLVTCDLSKEPPVKDVLRQLDSLKEENKKVKFEAKYVNIDMNAQLLLNQMRTGDFHFACVVKYMPYDSKVLGIITIEDILEELFGKIDENNERRVRSSVDERADNTVIGWCREAGTDEKYPLSFSQQLRVLQYLMAECQVLRSLDIGILKAKQLLSLDRIRIAKPKEKLELNEMFLVIWKGSVTIENILETFDQVVKVPSKRSSSKDTVSKERKAAVPALIIGKQLLNKLMKSLGSPFREVILEKDDVRQVTAITEVFYFKVTLPKEEFDHSLCLFQLRLEDLLNTINGCKMIKKNDKTLLGESLIQRLNSRQSTPVSTTPIQRSPSKSLEPKSPDEKIPLLKKD
ncbi:hypothetical protein CAEBREN_20554 [Caenorhabditis brenneri]|uniref:Metal transporter n=1 Tax=Caenorhabditis brenneri TaxID=135651 RepID=G0MFN6_CAEBE|nr:hypothetical protein CAEBREN_20554 [Caenorhabditis brenneri]